MMAFLIKVHTTDASILIRCSEFITNEVVTFYHKLLGAATIQDPLIHLTVVRNGLY